MCEEVGEASLAGGQGGGNVPQIEYWDRAKQRTCRDFYTSFFFSARERACEVMEALWGAGDR
jgi:hypothetical protein